jgi:hypothetical protein
MISAGAASLSSWERAAAVSADDGAGSAVRANDDGIRKTAWG